MLVHLDSIKVSLKVKVIGESSRSQAENVAEVVDSTSSRSFLVVVCVMWRMMSAK